jgi:hypothetical protein
VAVISYVGHREERTILVMLEGLAEHTKGSQPQRLLGLGGTRRVQDTDDILQHVAGVPGDN